MSRNESPRADQLLESALKLNPEERAAFLRTACGSDQALYDELNSALADHGHAAAPIELDATATAKGAWESGDFTASGGLAPGMQVGAYEIAAFLGAGGMGQVYRARDTRLGRDVALKFLSGDASAGTNALEPFKREARAASALNHPNICTLHDISEYEGRPFIVMELLDGESLKDRLEQGPVPIAQVVEFGIQIAHALEALHSAGIVHRDLKPANVFLTRRGPVKLLDMGIAKVVNARVDDCADVRSADSNAATDITLTSYGTAIGTVAEGVPESVESEGRRWPGFDRIRVRAIDTGENWLISPPGKDYCFH